MLQTQLPIQMAASPKTNDTNRTSRLEHAGLEDRQYLQRRHNLFARSTISQVVCVERSARYQSKECLPQSAGGMHTASYDRSLSGYCKREIEECSKDIHSGRRSPRRSR